MRCQTDLDVCMGVVVVQEVYVNSLRAILVRKISNTGQGLTDKIPRLLLGHLNEITQGL
jgi:hypothetical protein